MFIVFNDIPYWLHSSTRIIWRDLGYFVLHLLLLAASVIGFIIANKLIKIRTTASFGIAPIDYENNFMFSSAYKAADIALYQAKDQGRNRIVKATV